MNITKYLISAGVLVTLLSGVFSLLPAEVTSQTIESSLLRPKMVLQVGPEGRVLLRGTVSAVNASSLVVKSWGGDWTINTTSETKFAPENGIAQFKVGDFVGLHGTVNQSAVWTIDASLVRNWTAKAVMQENREMVKKERHNNEQEIKDVMKRESPKNWQGAASNVNPSGNSLTLTIGGTVYSVTVVAGAKLVNERFLTIAFSDIKNGDTVRVWGPLTSDTAIAAYVVRDISISGR